MVMDMFAGRLHAKVVHVHAAEQFLGVDDQLVGDGLVVDLELAVADGLAGQFDGLGLIGPKVYAHGTSLNVFPERASQIEHRETP